jgi:hypothetical protein
MNPESPRARTTERAAGRATLVAHQPVVRRAQLREAAEFVLIWAGVLLLAIAVEVAGLYLLDALR